jgi:hypothetical protein
MRLDGAATDAQLGRDRFVGETARHAATSALYERPSRATTSYTS